LEEKFRKGMAKRWPLLTRGSSREDFRSNEMSADGAKKEISNVSICDDVTTQTELLVGSQ
jgi:hypothetical protein